MDVFEWVGREVMEGVATWLTVSMLTMHHFWRYSLSEHNITLAQTVANYNDFVWTVTRPKGYINYS